MQADFILPLLALLPMAASIPAYFLGKKRLQIGYGILIGTTAIELLLCLLVYASKAEPAFSRPGIIGLGLSMRADGFRTLYTGVACLMWLMTSLLTPQYFSHGHKQSRYIFYTLFTMGATVGVFLSDDLITCFLFFEIMSFTSYCWVVHEENPAAMRAGETYLAIAVMGGMAMLMGLMLLQAKLGTLKFDELIMAAQAVPRSELYLPGALILAGFGAKAGMYPLHVWLPKAHPVAPAPASALLSGILTKVGIFGILVVSTRLFSHNLPWGNLILILGLINMFLGALLALFSVDLKRTLACSSMSQIGFILVGVGMQGLLGDHNALAAQGTVLHMLNHSLIKLVLFMAAGVVYLSTHSLNLNDVRGYGRKHFGLMLCFTVGALSLSGFPLLSGYASKTLLHESIVEYIDHLHHLGQSAFPYQAAEWVFIVSGGITFCYMLKLFITIFVQKHPTRQQEFDRMPRSMNPLSAAAVGGSALLLFFLGLYPERSLVPLAEYSLPFLRAHPPEHAVHFLTRVNLIGAFKSLFIGLLLYLTVVRYYLSHRDKKTGCAVSLDRWPKKLDLENLLYRPLVFNLKKCGIALCTPLDLLMDKALIPVLYHSGSFVAKVFDSIIDSFIYTVRHTVFKRIGETYVPAPKHILLTAVNQAIDTPMAGFKILLSHAHIKTLKYGFLFHAAWDNTIDFLRRHLINIGIGLFSSLLIFILFYVLKT